MSLQFIFGNSGSGKSGYLYRRIIKESMDHPEKNYIVLVPEQFTMQTQKDLCLAHPRGGIMNIDVLSFGRLAHRIFEEVGCDDRIVLDDEGKNLILRRIASSYENDLTVLKGNLRKQGYISEVKSVISEFMQYGIGYEQLDEFMGELTPDSYLFCKLHDIRTVYEGFETFLREKYVTKEEMLDVLSSVIPASNILKGSVIAMDGFTGFTPVQDRVIGELLQVCDRVFITVEMDQREDPFVFRHPYQLFALSKRMVTSLVRIAGENGTAVDDPVYLYGKPLPRFCKNPDMAFLESELFRYSGRQYHRKDTAEVSDIISIHEAQNPRMEAMYTAEQIRCLVRKKGYRYREIAVIAPDLSIYADLLEQACRIFHIPVFMDYKKSILLNSFVEYLRSLLAMAEQNFTYESVFRHLRTGLCGFTSEETDQLENYCLALGIRGYKKWQQAWVRRTADWDEEKLNSLNHLRVLFVEKTTPLMTILKQRKKTVKDITVAVCQYLEQEKIQDQLLQMENEFQKNGELTLAKEYSQIYRITMELFDKFIQLLGDEPVTVKEYTELLDAGLEEAKVGVIPPSLDQVVIGDVERTRIKNIKALFFLGANDTLLPGNTGSSGLLSERDREKFRDRDLSLSPGPKEQMFIQKFYLYLHLTKPSEYLYLSFSKVSKDGKSLRPAYLIQDIRRLFPDIHIVNEERRKASEHEITRKTGLDMVASGLRDRMSGLDAQWKELYTWFLRDGRDKEQIRQILNAAFLKREWKNLTPETAKKLYPDWERISVTRLEQFAACSYAHFLTYGLRLSDRKEYRFEALDLGNIAHQSLERFSRRVDREKMKWTDLTEEKRKELIGESVEESVIDYGNTVLFSTARNEYMIGRITKLIERSVWALTKQMEKGDFVPGGYEMKFGSGKIDRIDLCEDEDGVYVKVTDYKTGMKSFDITALYHGLQLQLPVYMNAAMEVEKRRHPGKEIIPAGIFYYRIQDPMVERKDTKEEVEKNILKELRLDGLVNAEENVIRHLERDLSGSSVLYPLGRNKDGSLSRNSRALPEKVFTAVLKYARKIEQDLKDRMYEGEAAARPYELENSTGCDYCAYRDICGFDVRIPGCSLRRLAKYSMEEAAALIRMEVEEDGHEMD